ncbi:MAG: nitrile hydratase subunit alpha [Gemmatimonadota bacterium]
MSSLPDTDRPHAVNPDPRLRAVAADLEYFRAKRLEPRVLHLVRRGVISLNDLIRAGRDTAGDRTSRAAAATVEQRLRALEDRLDALVAGIAAVAVATRSADVVIEDIRRERGDYHPFLRIAKRTYSGSVGERMSQLERGLADSEELLDVFTRALLDTGEITARQLDQQRQALHGQGYRNGARLVARAWVDPEFKRRLLETGREAARELDIPPGRLGKLGVAENTEREHNVVVCTLCSCYPHDLLGDPPWWYRTDEYKRRIIEDPRAMLTDLFGLEVPPERAVTVRDSTSDVRWMVLPRRPEGSEAMTEDELADLVTPESLVGTAEPRTPQDPA